MKKFKKFFAFTAVLAVFVSFGSTGTAAAKGNCPPHGPYVERLLDISQSYEVHYVPVKNPYTGKYLYDSKGEKITEKCEIKQDRYHIGVYCDGCDWFLNDYRDEGPVFHSVCPVG